jgi:hypothetical protein
VAGSGPRILMLTAAAGVEDRVDGLELRMTTSAGAIATHCPLGRSLLLANGRSAATRGPRLGFTPVRVSRAWCGGWL